MKLEVRRTCSHHVQSSSDKYSSPSVEDYPIGNIQLGMIFETCGRSFFLYFKHSAAVLCTYVHMFN
jgi:hypothetical protein